MAQQDLSEQLANLIEEGRLGLGKTRYKKSLKKQFAKAGSRVPKTKRGTGYLSSRTSF